MGWLKILAVRNLTACAVGAALFLILAANACGLAAESSGFQLLTNLTQIRLLDPAEAGKGYPVEVRGIVTCPDLLQAWVYLQAGDEGIYIRTPSTDFQLRPGDEVIVRATTLGAAHNFLVSPQYQLLSSGVPLPRPAVLVGEALYDTNYDSRYALASGRVERVSTDGPRWQFSLRQGPRRFVAQLLNPPGNPLQPSEWVGARLEFTGPVSIRSTGSNSTPVTRLSAWSLSNVRLLEPAGVPKKALIGELRGLLGSDERVAVTGRVVPVRGGGVELKDSSGTIAFAAPPFVREGDDVELSGFVGEPDRTLTLESPEVRLIERDAQGTSRAVITRVDQLRSLSFAEADAKLPVRIRGVVMYNPPNSHNLFVHDGTAGAFAWLEKSRSDLVPGTEIEVAGRSGGGLFAPIIDGATVVPGKLRGLPPPRRVTFVELMSGRDDSQMVEFSGVVRRVVFTNDVAEMKIAGVGGAVDATLPASREQALALEHARVRVQGVAGGRFNGSHQMIGAQIFIPGLSSITVEEPAPAPFLIKPATIGSVFGFRQGTDPYRRVRISGTVTWQAPEGGLYLVDGFNNLFVDAAYNPEIHTGMLAEAVGYPAAGGSHAAPFLENAIVRPAGQGIPFAPADATTEALRNGEFDATFTRIHARLLQSYERNGAWHSTWRTQDAAKMVFDAVLHSGRPPNLEANTIANISGIVRIQMDDQRQPSGFVLHLRSPADIAALSTPPWWNARRAWQAVYMLLAAIAISTIWILFLRAKVEQQTSLVRARLAEHLALEKQYRDLFEDNPHPMWVYDLLTLRFIAVNSMALARYGYTREEFLKMDLMDIRPPGERERLKEFFRTRGNPNQDAAVWLHQRKNGELLWVELTTREVVFAEKKAKLVLAHDITARKKAEADLLRLATAVEQTSEMVLILDHEGTIQYLNPSFTRVTGFSAEEAIGRRFDFIDREPAAQARFEQMVAAMGDQRSCGGLFSSRNKSGDRYEEKLVLSAVHDTGGKLLNYIVVSRDVSKESALEQQVRLSQKMEAVGLLAGGVAHDFNNLLQVIQGYTLLSLQMAGPDKELHDNLEQVKSASERAAQLTRQLLVFSRQQNLEETDLDLGEALAETLKMVRRVIGEHIEVELSAAPDLQKIRADRGRIEQVIVNLCVNARDAMPTGGRLSIQVSNTILTKADLGAQSASAAGSYVCLRVSDTGCGMDSKTLSRVFEPFFSTKPKDKGTGLGLSVVYGIVEQHRGVIRVHSKPGAGATFLIYFPASRGEAKSPVILKTAAPEDQGNETILLVEDEPAVRLLAARILKRAGYEVQVAADGMEACTLFEKHAADIDLVLMDVIMPRMGGREAYERIAKKRQDIPVIFCSGYSERELGAEFLQSHGLDLLPKPYLPDELLTRVRERLRAGQAS